MPDQQTILWKLVSLGVGTAAGFAAERVVAAGWTLIARQGPPSDTADRRRPWLETVAWAAAVGIGAGVARAVANRSAAAVWEAATNDTPPGVPSA
jgi:hypothetical protein